MEVWRMVARNDEHDHGDGPVCPGCRFREVLAEELDWAADQDERVWHRVVGEIKALAGGTLTALTLLRASRLDDETDDDGDEHARMAAVAISRLGGAIEELWHALMDDDGQDDDPGAGL